MRSTRWLPSILAVGLGAVACSSSSSGGGGSTSTDASSESAPSCGDIAACYDVTVTVDPGSPASCGTGARAISDYTAVTGDGPITTSNCQGQLSNCIMTLTCQDGMASSAWKYTFTGSGFSATIKEGTCSATAVGMRLASCPAATSDAGGGAADATVDGGVDGGPTSDATIDRVAEAGPGADAAPDGGDALAPVDSSVSDGGGDAGADAGASDAGAEGDAEAGAPDGGGDDGGDAESPDGGADADDGSNSG